MDLPVVLVNATHSKSGGGRVYLMEVIPRLAAMADDLSFVAVCRPSEADDLRSSGVEVTVVHPPDSAEAMVPWLQIALPRIARRAGADLVYALANYGPLSCGRRCVLLLRNTTTAATWARSFRLRVKWKMMDFMTRVSVRRCGGGIAISHTYKREVVERYGVDPSSVEVVHHGYSDMFTETGPGPVESGVIDFDDPYVLAVGDIYPHKNYLAVLDSFARASGNRRGVRLVVVGSPLDSDYSDAVNRRANAPDLKGRVVFLGRRPQTDLPGLYRGAHAVMCLSLAEAFGIAQVEAMACGAPLVASDLPVYREVAAEAGIFVDPSDPAAIATELGRLLDDDSRREAWRRRSSSRAKAFSWERTAEKTLEVLRRRLDRVAADTA